MNKRIKIVIAAILLGLYLISMFSMASAVLIESVSTNPKEIAPGETAKISIKIENDADNDIDDVSISLNFREVIKDAFGNTVGVDEIPFAPFDSSSETSFDEIKDGKSKTAEFEIIALSNAESGIYKIPVEINYKENGDMKTRNSLISVVVNSEPILGINIEKGLLLKGMENELSIKVVNKGLSDMKFLELEIGSSTNYNLFSPSKIYIGDIDSDDFDVADFKIYFSDKIPDTASVPVTVFYRDALNNEYTESFSLPIKVYTNDKAIELGLLEKNNTRMYFGVIVVFIIVYIAYKKIKKRRKAKLSEEK